MTIENQLKNLICEKYGSMRNFARKIGISQSTLATILRRGVQNASISTVIKICDALGISVDALAENRIAPKKMMDAKEYKEFNYILNYMLIDGQPLSVYERFNLRASFNMWVENIRQTRILFKTDKKAYGKELEKYFVEFNLDNLKADLPDIEIEKDER